GRGTRDGHGAPVSGLANPDRIAPQSSGSDATTWGLQQTAGTPLAQYTGRIESRAHCLWSGAPAGGGWRIGLWLSRLSGTGAGDLLPDPTRVSGHDPCRAADSDALARGRGTAGTR